MKTPLAHILITRPSGQESYLRNACERRGLTVSHLPAVQIVPIIDNGSLQHHTRKADVVLFTSVNSVRYAQAVLPLKNTCVHAIGQATAQALTECGQTLEIQPQSPYNSEAYLQQLSGGSPGKLLIIKGQGGRQLIHDQLSQRGWSVSQCDVYSRVLPKTDPQRLDAVFAIQPPDIVSVSSNEGLQNLVVLASQYKHILLSLPLIVNSERCARLARELSFVRPALLASCAGDDAQLEQLDTWLSTANRRG